MPDVWEPSAVKWNSLEATTTGSAGSADAAYSPRRYRPDLGNLVATKVLPRVVIARSRTANPGGAKSTFAPNEIAQFAKLSLRPNEEPVTAFVERALARGLSLDDIYLDLLRPTAQYLGEQWNADTCDFATVTLGMCQLHRLVRDFSPAFQSTVTRRRASRHVLLTPSDNEQHSFGLIIVAEFLRRDGWIVTSGPFSTSNGLASAMRKERFSLVGFSLSCDSGLDKLAGQIRTVRRCSLNRDVWVMVGGRVFLDRPDLVARVGADATACDARQAATVSRKLASMQAEGRA